MPLKIIFTHNINILRLHTLIIDIAHDSVRHVAAFLLLIDFGYLHIIRNCKNRNMQNRKLVTKQDHTIFEKYCFKTIKTESEEALPFLPMFLKKNHKHTILMP